MPHRCFDHVEARCPELGGPVTFGYCRGLAEGLPCPRALECFAHLFPVGEYFRRVLREATFDRAFLTPRAGRVDQLLRRLLSREGVGNQGEPSAKE